MPIAALYVAAASDSYARACSRPRRARRGRRHLHGRAAAVLGRRRHAEPRAPQARQAGCGEEAGAREDEGARYEGEARAPSAREAEARTRGRRQRPAESAVHRARRQPRRRGRPARPRFGTRPDGAGGGPCGRAAAGAGFVAINVLAEAQSRPLLELLGALENPGILVYRRPDVLFARMGGFADSETVAQAAANARR